MQHVTTYPRHTVTRALWLVKFTSVWCGVWCVKGVEEVYLPILDGL